MKNIETLNDLKSKYHEVEIPKLLSERVDLAIAEALNKRETKSEKGQTNSMKQFKRGLMGAVAALAILTTAVNVSPTFADAAKQIPLIGELVKILEFRDGKASGGVITDGSDVSEVSLKQMEGYETFKIAFEQDGNAQALAGAYEIKYQENPYTMTISLYGVRMMSASDAMKAIKNSPLVKQVYPIVTLDDSAMRFGIEFKGAVVYKAVELKNPSSLVIEIAKEKNPQIENSYQVVTEEMPAGEGLAMAEEMLMASFKDMRVLPTETEGQYYLELGQFKTEEEAKKAVSDAKALGLTVTYRKVN